MRNRKTFRMTPRTFAAPSRTVPDETLTIRELVTRFVRNTPPADLVRSDMVYDEEATVDAHGYLHGNGNWDVNPITDGNLDFVDIADMQREYKDLKMKLNGK
jgi:hypothetical protein